jgi:hypothetical protein
MDTYAGAYMTLIIPLALLFVVLGWWWVAVHRARSRAGSRDS